MSVEKAFVKALHRIKGTFAVAMISSHDRELIFCAREKSPLILGIGSGASFIGSDVNAFLPYTRRAILLDDGEYAVLSRDGYCARGITNGEVQMKQIMEIDWDIESAEKAGHQHYMEKEIWEQPEVVVCTEFYGWPCFFLALAPLWDFSAVIGGSLSCPAIFLFSTQRSFSQVASSISILESIEQPF